MVGAAREVHDEVMFGVVHSHANDSTALVWWLVCLTALMFVAIVVVAARSARRQSLDQIRRGTGTSTAGSNSSKVST